MCHVVKSAAQAEMVSACELRFKGGEFLYTEVVEDRKKSLYV